MSRWRSAEPSNSGRCEEDNGDVILTRLTPRLGSKGLEAQELDVEHILEEGGQRLVVALIERERTSVTLGYYDGRAAAGCCDRARSVVSCC